MEKPESEGLGGRLWLVLGGARSGKSAFVERLARDSGKRVAFIATATAGDQEMGERIARHRGERPADWLTIEEPLDLAGAVKQAGERAEIIILDCLTLWLSNWMTEQGYLSEIHDPGAALPEGGSAAEKALEWIEAFLEAVRALPDQKTILVVSNEVGLGLVPIDARSRFYRDTLGWVNQRVGGAAEKVYLLVAGQAIDIKRLSEEPLL